MPAAIGVRKADTALNEFTRFDTQQLLYQQEFQRLCGTDASSDPCQETRLSVRLLYTSAGLMFELVRMIYILLGHNLVVTRLVASSIKSFARFMAALHVFQTSCHFLFLYPIDLSSIVKAAC